MHVKDTRTRRTFFWHKILANFGLLKQLGSCPRIVGEGDRPSSARPIAPSLTRSRDRSSVPPVHPPITPSLVRPVDLAIVRLTDRSCDRLKVVRLTVRSTERMFVRLFSRQVLLLSSASQKDYGQGERVSPHLKPLLVVSLNSVSNCSCRHFCLRHSTLNGTSCMLTLLRSATFFN